MDRLAETGDLRTIAEPVSWDLELGALARLACETDGPALLFENVLDYGTDVQVLCNPMATWRRVAVAFGLAPDASIRDIYREYERREGASIPPRVVSSGPCKDVMKKGGEIDLFSLPAPMLHEGDGGRYIGTWDLVASQDPVQAWTNWGMYRFMLYDERHMTGFPRPTSHLGKVFQECYAASGRPMPIALVIGADPLSHFAAAATYRLGGDEASLAGGLRGEAVDVVRCETNGLLVPATAEIVIEGEVLPDRVGLEGPYGEYPGYRTGEMGNGVLVRATAMTYRRRPIYTVDATGYKDDSSTITALSGAIAIQRRLEKRGVPVVDVHLPAEGAVHWVVVSVSAGGPEVGREILETLTSRRALVSKVFMVDPDVDVFDLGQVMHAFATKCDPGRGIHVVRYEGRANTLTPCYSQADRLAQRGATVLFDCTWPREWSREWEVPVKATLDTIFPSDVGAEARKRWRSYGFDD
jgi:4-hydroxy-3-polyprenylbenzoate decarboxylase